MLAEGKNKAKQTAPSSFSATEGAAEDEDNQTLSLAKTTLSPIMAMEENEWCERAIYSIVSTGMATG